MIAVGKPVAPSFVTMSPEIYGSPSSLFAGKPPTHLTQATSVSAR